MRLIPKRCHSPGCSAAADHVRCQDCGRRFCADHIGATDFSGVRRAGAGATSWTRFVCTGCAARSKQALLTSAARPAREQAGRNDQGSWSTARRS